MARLEIGVAVSGQIQVDKLATSLGNADKALDSWIKTSKSLGSNTDRTVRAVSLLDAEFKKLAIQAQASAASLTALFQGPKASATAAIYGQVAAVEALAAEYEQLIAVHAKQTLLGNAGVVRLREERAAIEANMAAYKRLQQAGEVGATYNKAIDYSGLEERYAKENALIESRVAHLKDLEAEERKLQRIQNEAIASQMAERYRQEDAAIERHIVKLKEAEAAERNYQYQRNKAIADQMAERFAKEDAVRAKLAAGASAGGYDYAEQMRKEEALYDSVTGKIKQNSEAVNQLGDAWDEAGKKSRTFHDALRGASGAMGALWMTYGQMAPLMAGFAVAASTMATISKGAEFDFLTRSIQKLSGEGYESVGALQAIQKELMGMQGLVHTPAQLASGMLEFARAGIPAAQAVKDMAEVSKFSFLGEMDMGKTVETIVGLMSAFKQSSATPALNQIAVIADATSVSLQQMAEAFKNTTSLGTVMGLSLEDVALSIGVLGQAGVRGATAGAALNTMMYKLAAPTATTKRKMDELGTSFDVFDSATGKIKPLVQIAEELAEVTRSMDPKQMAGLFESMVGLRGVKALGAMVDMARNGSAEFERLKKAIKEVGDTQPGDASSYLAEYYDLVAVSGKVQLQVLKADLDRLFTANYDNASVVNAVKELQKLINEPGTAKVLEGITASVIKLASTFLNLANAVGSVITLFNKLPGAKFISWFGSEGLASIEGKLKGVEEFIDFLEGKASTLINILPTAAQKGLGLEGMSKTLADFSNKQGALKPTVDLEQLAKYYDLLESIDKQAEEISKREIDLINEERLANMAQLKASLSGVTQTQEEFNERLRQGKERIDALADAKIAEALKKDLSAAMAEWDAYFIDVLAISTRTVDESAAAAVRTVAVTADAMEAIANKARSVSQQMAADAYASAQQAGQSAIAGVWSALKAGVAGYASEVSKFLSATGGGMTQEGNKAFEMLERKMALYKAQGMAEDMKPSARLRGAQGAAIVRETAQYAELDSTLQKYLLTKSEMDAVANKTGAAKGYKGSAFSAELVAQAPEQVRKYIDLVTDKTVEGISGIYGPRVQKALEAENKLAIESASAGIKAENEALKQLRATITGYTNDAKDADKTAKDWLKGNDSTLKNMEKLNKSFAEFSDFQPFTQIDYNANDMLAKYSDDLEAYKKEQEELPALIQATTDAYNKAKGARDGFVADLAANGAGSSQEDINQLHAYDMAVKSLEGHVDDLNKRHSELQNLQKSGIQNQEQLNAAMTDTKAFRMQMSAYNDLGTISKETYARIEGMVEADVKKFEEATGDKLAAAELLYQRMLKYQVAVAKGEEDIQGLMRAGLGLYEIKVDDDALEFYKDAMPQAIGITADAMAQFSRDVMQGNATAADAWRALGDTVSDVIFGIIQDLIKLQMETAIMGIGQSLLPSFFGSATGSTSGGTGNYGVGVTGGARHTGGVVGVDPPTFTRTVPMEAYATAPKFHSGFLPGEYPAILKEGESVLTPGQMAAIGSRSASSPVTINVNNNASGVQASANVTSDGNGGKTIEIMIDELVAGQIDRIGSKSNKALQRRGATTPLIRR